MSTRLIAGTIMSAVLLAVVLLLALRGFESPSTEPNEPIQYPNEGTMTVAPAASPEPTVQYSNEHIQYHNELPDTSGVKLW